MRNAMAVVVPWLYYYYLNVQLALTVDANKDNN